MTKSAFEAFNEAVENVNQSILSSLRPLHPMFHPYFIKPPNAWAKVSLFISRIIRIVVKLILILPVSIIHGIYLGVVEALEDFWRDR